MDWNRAIERNSGALKRIVAMLFAMAGLSATPTSPLRGEVAARSDAGGGDDALATTPTRPSDDGRPPPSRGRLGDHTLPRRLHRAILRLLRPAESAVRRLIIIAARGLVVAPSQPSRPRKPKPPSIFLRKPGGTGIVMPPGMLPPGRTPRPAPHSISLPVLDPLQRPFRRRRPTPSSAPRISYPGAFSKLSPVKIRHPPEPDDRLDATRLTLRLQALVAALDDLPKQARRFARWRANRDAAGAQNGNPAQDRNPEAAAAPTKTTTRRFRRFFPLRPGRPPGSIRRPDHEVHELLTDLHGLAFDVLEHPDTS